MKTRIPKLFSIALILALMVKFTASSNSKGAGCLLPTDCSFRRYMEGVETTGAKLSRTIY